MAPPTPITTSVPYQCYIHYLDRLQAAGVKVFPQYTIYSDASYQTSAASPLASYQAGWGLQQGPTTAPNYKPATPTVQNPVIPHSPEFQAVVDWLGGVR